MHIKVANIWNRRKTQLDFVRFTNKLALAALNICCRPHGEDLSRTSPGDFWARLDAERLLLWQTGPNLPPKKRGAALQLTPCQHSGTDRTNPSGSRQEEMQCCHCPIWDIPESPKFSAPFILHWPLYYPVSTSISDKTSLPRSLYLIFLAQMGCRRDLLLFPPTQSRKKPSKLHPYGMWVVGEKWVSCCFVCPKAY